MSEGEGMSDDRGLIERVIEGIEKRMKGGETNVGKISEDQEELRVYKDYASHSMGYELSAITVMTDEGVNISPMLSVLGMSEMHGKMMHMIVFDMVQFKHLWLGVGMILGEYHQIPEYVKEAMARWREEEGEGEHDGE